MKDTMLHSVTQRASSKARKNKLVKINTDKARFTRRLMRDFSRVNTTIQTALRRLAKRDGVTLAEVCRRSVDKGGEAIFRENGTLRAARREAKRLGISIGHLYWSVAYPDRPLN